GSRGFRVNYLLCANDNVKSHACLLFWLLSCDLHNPSGNFDEFADEVSKKVPVKAYQRLLRSVNANELAHPTLC
ncbi:MAG: hypothetical protein VX426_03155, partial [Chloroflexota bacterium]|nr:hypothetical protein [Chloroflexota bacterium]